MKRFRRLGLFWLLLLGLALSEDSNAQAGGTIAPARGTQRNVTILYPC